MVSSGADAQVRDIHYFLLMLLELLLFPVIMCFGLFLCHFCFVACLNVSLFVEVIRSCCSAFCDLYDQ